MESALKKSLFYRLIVSTIHGIQSILMLLFEHSIKKNKSGLKWVEGSAVNQFFSLCNKRIHRMQESLHRHGEASFLFGPEGLWKGRHAELLNQLDPFMVLIPINFMFIDYAMRHIGPLQGFSGIWDEAVLGLYFLYLILRPLWMKANYLWSYSSVDLLVGAFFAVGIALFALVSPEMDVAIDGYRAVYQYLLWYFIFRQLIKPSNRHIALASLVLSGSFLGWHSVYQIVRKVPMPGNWVDATETITTRAFSIIGSPNILSAVFVLLLPVVCAYAWTQKSGIMKWIAWTAVPAMLFGFLYTYARQAYLALAGAVGIYFILFYPAVLKYMIVAVGAALLALKSVANRLFYLFTPEYFAKSAKGGRIIRYQYAIEQWLEKPFFGQGMGRFGGAVATKYELTPFYVDSYYFKTLGEMGMVGLISLLALLSVVLMHLKRLIHRQQNVSHMIMVMGMFIGLLGLFLQNAVENVFEVPLMIVWFWAVVAIALTYETNEASDTSHLSDTNHISDAN